MLPQEPLDRAIRAAIRQDRRISFALAYGSFPQGLADAHSDLEYYLYLVPGTPLDPAEFLGALTPLALAVTNEFGTPNFVTPELLRLELHVCPEQELPALLDWPGLGAPPSQMLVKDRDGRLRTLLDTLAARPAGVPDPQQLLDRLLNMLTVGSAVLARGERLRALELLGFVQAGLLRLARLSVGAPQPLTVTRRAELELPPQLLARFQGCAGGLAQLETSQQEALAWAAELAEALGLDPRPALLSALRARLERAALVSRPGGGL